MAAMSLFVIVSDVTHKPRTRPLVRCWLVTTYNILQHFYTIFGTLFNSNPMPSDWWPNYWPIGQYRSRPKASGKIRVLYISLCNIRWVATSGVWENNERGFRYLPEHCDFQNTLEEMVRNQLVCGVNNEQIQRMLLAESSLDFKKALNAYSIQTRSNSFKIIYTR